jgi:hypothetical protein
MPTRNGKIANLPSDIREQLNLRLLEGETGRELAVWLNALPAAQTILGSQFNGAPISEVNLTHWRQGGYLQWLTERECFDSAHALADTDGDLAKTGLSAERLLNILTLRFGQLLMRWDLPPEEGVSETEAFAVMAKKARILQGISRSVLAIHRIQLQRSKTPHSLLKNAPLPMTPTTSAAPAPKPPLPSHPPKAAKNRAEPHADRASDAPAAPDLSTPRPVISSNSVPGLRAAVLNRRRKPEGGAGGGPEILSGPIAPSSLAANLSHTPFNLDPDSSEFLHAV